VPVIDSPSVYAQTETARRLAEQRDALQRDVDELDRMSKSRRGASSKTIPVSRVMRVTRRVIEICNSMMHARNDMAMRVRLRNITVSGTGEADRLDAAIGLLGDQVEAQFRELELRQKRSPQSPSSASQQYVHVPQSPRSPRSPRPARSPRARPGQEEELRQSMDLVRRCVEREKTFNDQLQLLEKVRGG